MNKAFPILGMLVLAMSPMRVSAQEARPSPEALEKIAEMMTEADLNGDGRTTRAELNQHRAQLFGKLDRNTDGVIDNRDSPESRWQSANSNRPSNGRSRSLIATETGASPLMSGIGPIRTSSPCSIATRMGPSPGPSLRRFRR